MRLRLSWFPIIALALAGCGGGEDIKLEKGPFLYVDRESLGFDQEFGSGTYVGASTFNALYLENRGDEPLNIKEFAKAGAGEFIFQLPKRPDGEAITEAKPLTLESRGSALIQIQFKPTKAQIYEGKLTINSNAENTPAKDILLSGKGITPP